MTFLTKKRKGNREYYYAVKTKRVNGTSRIIWQKYLGEVNTVIKRLTDPNIESVNSFDVGRLAAVLSADKELGFSDAVDKYVKHRKEKGLSPGKYMLAFIAGRSEEPISKKGLEEWFDKSYLSYLWTPIYKVNEQNFWNLMMKIDDKIMEKVTDDISLMLAQKGLTPKYILFDSTNFWTNIEHGENIPRTGKSKERRNDKNLIGLGMTVSDENIPFFGEAVPGNKPDSKLFLKVVDKLVARLKRLDLLSTQKIVLVFDRGCNSSKGIQKAVNKMHVIGGLKRNQAPELLQKPLTEFNPLRETNKGNKTYVYSTRRKVFGKIYRILVEYNPETAKKELAAYVEDKKEFLAEIENIKKSINHTGKGRKITKKGIRDRLMKITSRYDTVFKFDECQLDLHGNRHIGWIEVPKEEELKLSFGKRILFTDIEDWSDSDIVRAYNSKALIEEDFKFLKDKLLLPIKPVYHRKDKTIKVHVWLCVMGLLFFRYMMWKVKKSGMSVKEFFSALGKIKIAAVKLEEKKLQYVLERMDKEALQLFQSLDIGSVLRV